MMKFGKVAGIGEISMETEEVKVSDGPVMRSVPGRQNGKIVLVMQNGDKHSFRVAPLALSPIVQFAKLLHHINKGDPVGHIAINADEIHAAMNRIHDQVDYYMRKEAEKERDRREFILESLLRMTLAERMALPKKVRKEMEAHEKVLAERREEAEAQARADAMDDASRADCDDGEGE